MIKLGLYGPDMTDISKRILDEINRYGVKVTMQEISPLEINEIAIE